MSQREVSGAQLIESVKRALMHNVAVDVQQGWAVLPVNDSVWHPDFVK
jgi:hypothetical protein